MIAVLFELWPADATARAAYLDIAAALRTQLLQIDGFVSIERFESLSEKGKLLSLSIWRDEDAVVRWRQLEAHRAAQTQGRAGLFCDYRLRIADITRDYGMSERDEAPGDSRAIHG